MELFPQTAPQPLLDASVVSMRSGFPWLRALEACGTLFTHQVSSVLDGVDRVIMASKFPLLSRSAQILSSCKCWETGNKEAYDLNNSTDSGCLSKEQIFTSGFGLHGFRLIESYSHGDTVQHKTQKIYFFLGVGAQTSQGVQ